MLRLQTPHSFIIKLSSRSQTSGGKEQSYIAIRSAATDEFEAFLATELGQTTTVEPPPLDGGGRDAASVPLEGVEMTVASELPESRGGGSTSIANPEPLASLEALHLEPTHRALKLLLSVVCRPLFQRVDRIRLQEALDTCRNLPLYDETEGANCSVCRVGTVFLAYCQKDVSFDFATLSLVILAFASFRND
jgi:hypothetical protein